MRFPEPWQRAKLVIPFETPRPLGMLLGMRHFDCSRDEIMCRRGPGRHAPGEKPRAAGGIGGRVRSWRVSVPVQPWLPLASAGQVVVLGGGGLRGFAAALRALGFASVA